MAGDYAARPTFPTMFQFANPKYFYLLAFVVLAIVLGIGMHLVQRHRMKILGEQPLLRRLTPDKSLVRPLLKQSLVLLAAVALIFVLARPQILGGGTSQEKRKGIEVVLMMDVSNSMLANDIQPSRMERSKLLVSTLIDRMKDDKVGLGVFAGEAYPLLPITNDFVSAKMFLNDISANMVSLQGTSLASAIELANNSFTQENGVGKAIVVITDGEDNEDGAAAAAKKAAKDGRHVYILGVGSKDGGTIPTDKGPLCDIDGQVVITRVNADLGKEVAEAGGGMYIPVDNTSMAQDQLQAALKQLQQKESITATDEAADEQFQAVALIALMLLILEFFIMGVKNPLFKKVNILNRTAPVLLLLAFSLASAPAASAQTDAFRYVRQGNRAFMKDDFKGAEKAYLKALQTAPRNGRIRFNLGDTYMAEDNQNEALKQFAEAAKTESNKIVKAMSFHNMGYIHHKNKDYDKAIDYYKEALRNNPNDEDTRYNLALAQKQKKDQQQQQKQQQQKQNSQQDKQNPEQDKKQQDQQQPPEQQPDNDQMSQESTDQLLQLARQAENETRKKLQQAQPRQKSLIKNW